MAQIDAETESVEMTDRLTRVHVDLLIRKLK
jgi:hypothetical protein